MERSLTRCHHRWSAKVSPWPPPIASEKLAESIDASCGDPHRWQGAGSQGRSSPRLRLLQGRCPTFYCKQLAEHAAMLVAGDTVLTNEIEVG